MNIAFGTLLLFLILIPGLAFFRLYYSGFFSKQFIPSTPFETLFKILLPGILMQLLGVMTINEFSAYDVDFDTLSILLIGTDSADLNRQAFNNLKESLPAIVKYNLLVISVAGALGYFTKYLVRILKLDRLFKPLRFQNEWHYILTGEIFQFPIIRKKLERSYQNSNVDFVHLDALLETSEGTVLYSGIVDDYYLGTNGGLDRIFIKNAKRRYLKSDHSKNDPYYRIPGDYLILKYENIINLNLTYYRIKREKIISRSAIFGLLIIFLTPLLIIYLYSSPGIISNIIATLFLLVYIVIMSLGIRESRKKKSS